MSRDTITVNFRDGHKAGQSIVLPAAARPYVYTMPPFDVSSMQDESYPQPPPDVRYDIVQASCEMVSLNRVYICQRDAFTRYDVSDFDWLSYMGRATRMRVRVRAVAYFGFSGPVPEKVQLTKSDRINFECLEPVPQGWGPMDGARTLQQEQEELVAYFKQRLPTYPMRPAPARKFNPFQARKFNPFQAR